MANDRQSREDQQARQLGHQILAMLGTGADGGGTAGSYTRARRPASWFYSLAAGFLAGVLVATVVVRQVRDDGDETGTAVASEARDDDGAGTGDTGAGTPLGSDEGVDDQDGAAQDENDGAPAPEVAGPRGGGAEQDQGAGEPGAESTSGDAGAVDTTPTPDGGSASPGASTTEASAAKGVTSDTIKLGVLAPEANELSGDLHEAYEAEVDRWREEGLLPVHGRDVELVHHEYELLTENDGPPQRAACVDLAQEEEVFAVMAWILSPGAAECLAKEFETPVIASITTFDRDLLERTRPYFFHTEMVSDRVLRNWPHWAHEFGYLKDRTIGLYYSDDSRLKAQIDEHFRPVLEDLGYSIAEEQAASAGQGSNAIAVQRFQAAGVDTLFITTTGRTQSPDAFSREAEAQGYRPRYLLSDFESASNTADTVPVRWVPEQFDNVYAMTFWRRGETGAPEQEPPPPAGEECMDNYERYSGRSYDKSNANESGPYDAMQPTCDQGRAMINALHEVGPGLSEMRLVRALETVVQDQPSGALGDLSFSATSHDGASLFKTIEGDEDCTCWLQVQGFRNPWVE